ncbi:hypothetical protein HGRIS_013464 [Hohenbuehelia grisea]|uniref:UFSP1/2/DUB catalytic domain-containing protein n=1 Tax=Hohenbuehelia grisea TaxID=104357 RepID=A0ABR3IVL6_9AGAR
MDCQFCFSNLDKLTVKQREEHYEAHFSRPSGGDTSPKHRIDPKKPLRKILEKMSIGSEQDRFWFRSAAAPCPSNFTPGLIQLIYGALDKFYSGSHGKRGALCYDHLVHVSRELFDAGWGCGYRNFVMACTALLEQRSRPEYHHPLQHPTPPSVKNLQRWIEDAWEHGFDQEGYQQLGKSLIGSSQWVGVSDIWVAFSFKGIPVELVDFNLDESGKDYTVVLDWIVQYFSLEGDKSKIGRTDRMPLILQNQGHSRTIVGYEINQQGNVVLLQFDPSSIPRPFIREAALPLANIPWQSNATSSSASSRSSNPSKTSFASSSTLASSRSANSSTSPSKQAKSQKIHDFFLPSGKGKRKQQSNLPGVSLKRSKPSSVSSNTSSRQRLTGGIPGEVIEVDSDSDVEVIDCRPPPQSQKPSVPSENPKGAISPGKILAKFRLDSKRLAKHRRYQILWFPMGPLLSEAERMRRKVVTSTKIC